MSIIKEGSTVLIQMNGVDVVMSLETFKGMTTSQLEDMKLQCSM